MPLLPPHTIPPATFLPPRLLFLVAEEEAQRLQKEQGGADCAAAGAAAAGGGPEAAEAADMDMGEGGPAAAWRDAADAAGADDDHLGLQRKLQQWPALLRCGANGDGGEAKGRQAAGGEQGEEDGGGAAARRAAAELWPSTSGSEGGGPEGAGHEASPGPQQRQQQQVYTAKERAVLEEFLSILNKVLLCHNPTISMVPQYVWYRNMVPLQSPVLLRFCRPAASVTAHPRPCHLQGIMAQHAGVHPQPARTPTWPPSPRSRPRSPPAPAPLRGRLARPPR